MKVGVLYLSSISLPCVFRVAVFFIYVKYKVFIPLFSGILTKPSTPQEFEFLPIIHNIILDDYNATKIKVSAISTYFEIPSMDCLSKLKAHNCIQLVLRLRMGRGSVDRNWTGEEGNIWKILMFTIINCDKLEDRGSTQRVLHNPWCPPASTCGEIPFPLHCML